jgi:hypothetical protein
LRTRTAKRAIAGRGARRREGERSSEFREDRKRQLWLVARFRIFETMAKALFYSRQVLAGRLGSLRDTEQVGSSRIDHWRATSSGRSGAGPKGPVHEYRAMHMQGPRLHPGMVTVDTSPLSAITRRSLERVQARFSKVVMF